MRSRVYSVRGPLGIAVAIALSQNVGCSSCSATYTSELYTGGGGSTSSSGFGGGGSDQGAGGTGGQGAGAGAHLGGGGSLPMGGGGSDTGAGGLGGMGGQGGTGGAGGAIVLCEPGSTIACYEGPDGTLGQGICVGGIATCGDDGIGYGPCEGQIVPTDETCTTDVDDNCDGVVNEVGTGDCACNPGQVLPCYSGPEGTEGFGPCTAGTHVCLESGLGFGPCENEVLPGVESCLDPSDEDCDGELNESGEGCVCVPGSTVACYTGLPGTLDVGLCHAGTRTCEISGLGYGDCEGEVTPVDETCATEGDDNCDGSLNEEGEGCVCVPNSVGACYTGPQATRGVGTCTDGTRTCNDSGTAWTSCSGEIKPTLENCATLADENCDGQPCSGFHIWSNRYGDAGSQVGYDVATGSDRSIAVVGYFQGAVDFGVGNMPSQGSSDAFVAKLSSTGSALWSKALGDGAAQVAYGVTVDSEGSVIAVGFFQGSISLISTYTAEDASDAFVVKFNSSGDLVWFAPLSGTSDQLAYGVAVDANDNVIVVGGFDGTADFGDGSVSSSGALDAFVAKFDKDGVPVFQYYAGGIGDQVALSVTTDSSNNIWVGGRVRGTVDFGQGPTAAGGSDDAFVLKLDDSGNPLFVSRFGANQDQVATRVRCDSNDSVVVAGYFASSLDIGLGAVTSEGGSDVFVAKFASDGTPTWVKRYGDASNQYAYALDIDLSDSVLVGGQFAGTIDFGFVPHASVGAADAFAVKLDESGSAIWSRAFGAVSNQTIRAVASDAEVASVWTGQFLSSIDFGGGVLSSAGAADSFVAKFGP